MNTKPELISRQYTVVFVFVVLLFMLWGVAITMGDVLNKHFQNVLHISKSASGLVQLSIFGAYAVMGIPAGMFMRKFGYKNGVLLGLGLYAAGAFLFVPAANQVSFNLFRIALFVLACGLATLETVAHPLVAALGDEQTSDQRMNLAQAFNSLGGIVGPLLGSYFILRGDLKDVSDLVSVKNLYLSIGILISVIAFVFSFLRIEVDCAENIIAEDYLINPKNRPENKSLFRRKHFVFAVIAQFFNVAAQGGTWAYFINYGHEIMHFTDATSANYFALSIFMMMLGRFAGSFLMRFVKPQVLLAVFAMANVVMCVLVAQANGWLSFTSLLLINFFFSIMYPTIFSLGLKDLGAQKQQASSYIVMGVVGGAVFPPLMGLIANQNVAQAYYLPIICYLVIATFA
ncbi:MAG: L-fucose:H+ symporter permease, partial [Sphingobacteriaceae bacterium]